MNLYISDLHFGHKNAIKFDHRPFYDVEEMDRMLIQAWNARVNEGDHVYILGDFCYRNEKEEQWYLQRLKGHKHLIVGNHDGKLLKNEIAMSYFESVDQLLLFKDGDKEIVLCHYPLACWNKEQHGSWHIYGHIHNLGETQDEELRAVFSYMLNKERALNAGCMINYYVPVSMTELIENNRRYRESLFGVNNE